MFSGVSKNIQYIFMYALRAYLLRIPWSIIQYWLAKYLTRSQVANGHSILNKSKKY